jgi:hypothetical protein
MAIAISSFKEIAEAHILRDSEEKGKWTCECEACSHMRSLTGIRKVLDIRPIVRELRGAEERLEQLNDGPEKNQLMKHYLELHDRLASAVAR